MLFEYGEKLLEQMLHFRRGI